VPSEEAGKRPDGGSTEIREIVQRFRDWFPDQGYSIAEEYAESRCQVIADFHAIGRNGYSADYTAIFRAEGCYSRPHPRLWAVANSQPWDGIKVRYGENEAVFVVNVKIVKGKELVVPSIVTVRPKASDFVASLRITIEESTLAKLLIESVEGSGEGELHSPHCLIGCGFDEQYREVVPGRVQVVDGVPGDKWRIIRQLEGLICDTEQPFGIFVRLYRDRAFVGVQKALNDVVQLFNVSVGPVEFAEGASEDVGSHLTRYLRPLGD